MIRYIADMHFDDEDIIAYDNRPFDSTEEMNEAMIANWNRVVTDPEDLTWILGDFCAGDGQRWSEILSLLNGRKAMVLGNHDNRAAAEAAGEFLEEIAEYREIQDEGRNVVLCHYPIVSFRDHYFSWYHFYGHTHNSFEANVTENAKRLLQKLYVREDVCLMFNVGAMMPRMNYTPRSLGEITAASLGEESGMDAASQQ